MDLAGYFSTLSAFAGVVFGLSLVARHMTKAEQKAETAVRNEFRKWDSMSVIFELAGAGLLGALAMMAGSSPGGWVAVVLSLVVSGVGLNLYRHYLSEFFKLRDADRDEAQKAVAAGVDPRPVLTEEDRKFAKISLLPIAAYAASAGAFLVAAIVGDPALVTSLEVIAASVGWLAFSGTYHAMYWYQRSWERPARGRVGRRHRRLASHRKLRSGTGQRRRQHRVPHPPHQWSRS